MQWAKINGESASIWPGRRNDRVVRGLTPHTSPRHNTSAVVVYYRDGAVLTFLFDRSITITDLNAMIGRAGGVRKVILWDEMPSVGRSQRKGTIG
ncbi:hypothetical protein HF288_09365 [Acidithiobacillus caldus]|nr:hypothetical protein [Acidithiobacillus caldus]